MVYFLLRLLKSFKLSKAKYLKQITKIIKGSNKSDLLSGKTFSYETSEIYRRRHQ